MYHKYKYQHQKKENHLFDLIKYLTLSMFMVVVLSLLLKVTMAGDENFRATLPFENANYSFENQDFNVKVGDKTNDEKQVVTFSTVAEQEFGLGEKVLNYLFGQKEYSIEFSLINSADSSDLSPAAISVFESDLTNPSSMETIVQADNTLKITNVINDIDLKLSPIINSGVKENIIVNGSLGVVNDSYIYALTLEEGVILHRAQSDSPFGLSEDTYYFTDENNNYIAHFLPLVAYDSNGNETKNVTMEILPVGEGLQPSQGQVSNLSVLYFIAITVDKTWLADPALQYPITIDPSIVHDTKTEFDAGTLNRLQSTSSNRVELKHHELSANTSTVGLWHMNESTGQSAMDSSGNSNTGQLGSATGSDSQDPTWNTTSQKFGASALSFDGTDDYVTMGDKDIFSFTDNKFTISFWMKANDTTSNIGIIGKRGSPWEYAIYALSGTLRFETYTSDGAYNVYPIITTSYDTNWTNFTFSADGTNAYVYKNGVLVGTSVKNSSYTMSNTAMELEIGRSGNAGGLRYMNGSIDEVKISNRALSPEEIKQDAQYSPYGVYTSSVIDLGTNEPTWQNFSWTESGVRTSQVENDLSTGNLVAQWNFNETSGTTAVSGGSCGTSCNGTLNNFSNTTAQDATPMSGWTYENRLEYGADGDGSLMFDGVNDYVNAGDNNSLKITNNITLSAWVKTSESGRQKVIISKHDNGSLAAGYRLLITQYEVAGFRFYNGVANGSNSSKKITDGQWHYVVGTYNGSVARIYVDGNLDAESTVSSTISADDTSCNIGGEGNGAELFQGVIESPKIYSRALSADEINSNYQAGNIEFQTRTGSDTTPEDGGWEEWKSTATAAETAVDNLDSNVDNSGVYDWTIQNIGTNQNWIKKNNSIPTTSDTTSTDGRIPLGTTGKGDVSHTTAPKVIKDGDTYKMWYCGVNNTNILIYYATSPDGLNWTKVDNTIPSGTCDSNGSPCSYGNGRLGVGSSGRGDSSSVTTAAVIKDGSTYKMWYTASNGVNARIYYATSSDGLTWTKVNNNIPTGNCDSSINHNTPCSYGDGRLSLGSSGMADSNSVSVGNVIKDGDIYKMWYTANNGTYSTIAYAYSNDGLTWVKYDNTIPTISDYYGTNGRLSKGNTGTAESNYVNGPFVIKDSSVYKMWYVGQDGNYSYVLYATSLDGINWTKFDNTKPAVSDSSNTNGRIGNGTSSKSDTSKIFSPSVLVDNGIYRIWYQGSSTGSTVYRITYASMSSLPYTQKTDSTLKIEGAGSERCLIGQSQADAGTVGLWHFEETGGTGAYIKDSSGNGYNGTPTGTSVANGTSGKGRYFTGANSDIISIPGMNWTPTTFTVDWWMNPKSCTDYNQQIHAVNGWGAFYFHTNSTCGIYVGIDATNRFTPTELTANTLSLNQWQHFAYVYNGSQGYFYKNGQLLAGPKTQNTSTAWGGLYLGIASNLTIDGAIDEVRISNVARTADEIAAAYRLGADYHITRTLSSPINLATTNNKLPFQIASDRPGTSFILTAGESSYVNNELDTNTLGYWPMEESFSGGTNTMRECTDSDPIGTVCGGGKKFATGLVAMPSGCANSTSEPTCSGTDSQTKTWASAYGTNEPADSTTDGLGNTNNLYNSDPPTNLAANFCHDLIKTGYSDWYLPARTELNALNNQRTIIGGFASSYYWTSTEYNVSPYYYAYVQIFSGTTQTYTTKVTPYYYRCIRQYNSNQYKINDTGTSNLSGQAVGTSPAQGKFGKGRYFNGTSDYIEIADNNGFDLGTGDFSYSFWVNHNSLSTYNTYLEMGLYTAGVLIRQESPTNLSVYIQYAGASDIYSYPFAPQTNQWYFLTLTRQGSALKFYVNGQQIGTTGTSNQNIQVSGPMYVGHSAHAGATQYLNGTLDELRLSKIAYTATEIRQAYEIGQRSHPITIDFGASLDSGNLITGSSDLSFTVDATKKGLPTKGENLFIGDKIIIKENYNGTEYSAQGTVTSVNKSTGAVTVAAWDSGATFPSIGYSANADVFKWQKEIASIYSSLAGHRDNINKISLRVLDAKQGQSVWLDDLKISTPLMTNPTTNTIQSTPNHYFQYRAILSTTDTDPTPSVDDVELDYSTIEMTGASTSQSYINTNNNTAFNIQCNGVTDSSSGDNVSCEASFNQTNWYTVGSDTTPLSATTVQGTPDISSWTGYPSGDGSVTIYARAHNTTNDTYSGVYNFSVNKDVSRPAVTAITSVAGDTSSPYSDGTDDTSTLVVYTTTVDATGCRWSETDQTYGAMANNCTNTTNCTLDLSGKGQKDVYFGCLDAATNYSQPNYHLTYYIDIDPDIVAVDAGPSSSDRNSLTSDQWFGYVGTGSDDQISFSWTDPASPSDDTFYYVLNTTATNFITDGSEEGVMTTTNNYLDNINIGENVSYLHVRAKNGVDSWGTERIFIVKYDKTNPTVSGNNSSDQWYSSNPTITLSTSDTLSGINNSKYSWDTNDGTCRSSGTSFINSDTINIISNGNHTLYLCNEDNVGNQGSWSGVYKLDTSTPDIVTIDAGHSSSDRTSLTSDQWFNYTQTGSDDQISFSWTDPASPSDDYYYYLENDSSVNAISNSNLVGFWNFENDTTMIALDHSSQENHATLYGTSTTSGNLGLARSFNGTSDYLHDNALTASIPGNLTVTGWIKASTIPSYQERIIDLAQAGDAGLQVCIDSSGNILLENSGGPAGVVYGGNATDNNWHHFAVTRSGTTYEFFVDGISKGTTSGSAPTYSQMYFGRRQTGGDFYIGQIDDTKIFTRVLSSTEIINEYRIRLTQNNYLDGQTATEGTFYKHIRPINGADSWGTEYQFIEKYDKTAPTLSASGNSEQWYSINPSITLTTVDNNSGLNYSKYSWDTNDSTCRSAGTSFNQNDTLNIISDGTHRLYLCNEDSADNQGSWNGIYKLDTSTPDIVAVDAGQSSSDRTSLTSDQWFNYSQTGSDDQISFSWTDPSSLSGDYFYYLENDSTTNAFNNSGLVGWWNFENDTTVTAWDNSTYDHNGIISNAVVISGQLGLAKDFNGTSDLITINDDAELKPATNLSVSAWFNTEDKTLASQQILSKTRHSGYSLYMDSSQLCFIAATAYNDYRRACTSTASLNNNTWYYATGTYDGSNVKIYLNGEYQNQVAMTGNIYYMDSKLCIGAEAGTSGDVCENYYFKGSIDEVKVYSRVLSNVEILNEYKKRMTSNIYLDNQNIVEGINIKHIIPFSGSKKWGTEQQFIEKYDKTNPSVSADNSSDRWYGSNPTITLSTSDVLSGINYSKYSWDTNDSTCRSSGTSFNNLDTINIISNGFHRLYLCNEDNAGETGSWSGIYKLNTIVPDIVAIDSGPSASDRTSFTTAEWFNFFDTGGDDRGSYIWSTPDSP